MVGIQPDAPAASRGAGPSPDPGPAQAEVEALLRQVTHCRDEARELGLTLVEYILDLARLELGGPMRRVRARRGA